MVHIKTETLGDIIKHARQKSGITMENLASKINISTRYLYRIENENKKPSYEILYSLIRELSIPSDIISGISPVVVSVYHRRQGLSM